MMNPEDLNLSTFPLGAEQLTDMFTQHLHRIYCAKGHLLERLPELSEQANFIDLKQAITETWEDIGRQSARIEEIYILLDRKPSLDDCEELISLMESGFNAIFHNEGNTALRDMSILFYLLTVESAEIASFQLLMMVAGNRNDGQVSKLLRENYDEAKADHTLFLQITSKYINP